jgi:hypothetical protein
MSIQMNKNRIVVASTVSRFAELYSSSSEDEVEEGEIVEDTISRAQVKKEQEQNEKQRQIQIQTQDSAPWKRSGVNGVVIKIPKPEPEEKEQVRYVKETYEAKDGGQSFYYYLKYKGTSWTDIEYATDDDE